MAGFLGQGDLCTISYDTEAKCYAIRILPDGGCLGQRPNCLNCLGRCPRHPARRWVQEAPTPQLANSDTLPLRRRRVRRDGYRRAVGDRRGGARVANRGRRAGRHGRWAGHRCRRAGAAKPITAATTGAANRKCKKRCEQRDPLHCSCLLTRNRNPLSQVRRARHACSVLAGASRGDTQEYPFNRSP